MLKVGTYRGFCLALPSGWGEGFQKGTNRNRPRYSTVLLKSFVASQVHFGTELNRLRHGE
jgi:hypothetical protein